MQKIKLEDFPIEVHVSNRHVHITKENFEILFGKEANLTKYHDLVQPGQFASKETVSILGPKGKIDKVRIVGPFRNYTQVEISRSDSFLLGLNPPLRESSDLKNSAGITILGPKGKIDLKEGCIIALRHIHFSIEDALKLDIKDKTFVKILAGKGKGRETIFSDVICRVSKNYITECHLDIDEANASFVENGDKVFIIEKI